MLQNRKALFEYAKKFDQLCKEHNIWYSLDEYSLLGAVRHAGFTPWVEKFQVMTNVEGYVDLKRLFPQNVVDSSIDKSFPSMKVVFVEDKKKWARPQPFIEIRVVVPTTAKKAERYGSIANRIKAKVSGKDSTIRHAIDELFDTNRFEGFYLLDERHKKPHESWVQVISFATTEKSFWGYNFPVVVEYEKVLAGLFGKDYMSETRVPARTYGFPYPSKIIEDTCK